MRVGIIICHRYQTCTGAKCFRAARNREGAFSRYSEPVEIVAYTTCGGCPGGNVENVAKSMKKAGAQAIHFATGVLAGYPPCPYLDTLVNFTAKASGLPVVVGTHPMPTNYIQLHTQIGDWTEEHKHLLETFHLIDPKEAEKYDSTRPTYAQEVLDELEQT